MIIVFSPVWLLSSLFSPFVYHIYYSCLISTWNCTLHKIIISLYYHIWGSALVRFRMSNNIMFSKESMFWGWLGIKSRILELFLGILWEDYFYVLCTYHLPQKLALIYLKKRKKIKLHLCSLIGIKYQYWHFELPIKVVLIIT